MAAHSLTLLLLLLYVASAADPAATVWPSLPARSLVESRPLSPAQAEYFAGLRRLRELSAAEVAQRRQAALQARVLLLGVLDYPDGPARQFLQAVQRQRYRYAAIHGLDCVYENASSVGRQAGHDTSRHWAHIPCPSSCKRRLHGSARCDCQTAPLTAAATWAAIRAF